MFNRREFTKTLIAIPFLSSCNITLQSPEIVSVDIETVFDLEQVFTSGDLIMPFDDKDPEVKVYLTVNYDNNTSKKFVATNQAWHVKEVVSNASTNGAKFINPYLSPDEKYFTMDFIKDNKIYCYEIFMLERMS